LTDELLDLLPKDKPKPLLPILKDKEKEETAQEIKIEANKLVRQAETLLNNLYNRLLVIETMRKDEKEQELKCIIEEWTPQFNQIIAKLDELTAKLNPNEQLERDTLTNLNKLISKELAQ
jgi:ABC-type transporter Mla subunit MlaD